MLLLTGIPPPPPPRRHYYHLEQQHALGVERAPSTSGAKCLHGSPAQPFATLECVRTIAKTSHRPRLSTKKGGELATGPWSANVSGCHIRSATLAPRVGCAREGPAQHGPPPIGHRTMTPAGMVEGRLGRWFGLFPSSEGVASTKEWVLYEYPSISVILDSLPVPDLNAVDFLIPGNAYTMLVLAVSWRGVCLGSSFGLDP
ncbi:hypothetical protein L228DRAFT_156645 [Xylona heveae TC161]|uniref:Uncharacterized protein n=1 Tax=Xylona heveae (strain CBS 132557 / TC161) TaxID=1328760 RepID=A0A165G1D5_XYLHT|nr:hypothetical protein L228DRAFT_156645 [Xylona heveae TC161]KZF21626.1 hypothetical protein L228DRAFT_156645 [Xylona heveae TC161]